ncbi:MAG: biotin--[acetyl-CoA-carboxylase] ligase [Synergistaceae bacterium]|nr:biotin--[acetyl-CoA-carboxylase] ligase [Synergistaceae bacterium]
MDGKFSAELLGEYLAANSCAAEIIFLDKTVSTQEEAKRFAAHVSSADAVLVAEDQYGGRGRNKRRWFSAAGVSLSFSVLTHPDIPLSCIPFASYAASLSVLSVLQSNGTNAEIKWPNDLLVNGRKICGIISEGAVYGSKLRYLATGFGMNVNNETSDFPDELRTAATSVRIETGRSVSREKLAAEITVKFTNFLKLLKNNPKSLLEIYRLHCTTLGKRVKIILENEEIIGTAINLNDDGSLLIEKNGEKLSFFAADVIHLRNANQVC